VSIVERIKYWNENYSVPTAHQTRDADVHMSQQSVHSEYANQLEDLGMEVRYIFDTAWTQNTLDPYINVIAREGQAQFNS
jgi:hypothetical protein